MENFFRVKLYGEKSEIFGNSQVLLGNTAGGVFSRWNWNGETLTLTNDRYGFYPIYYFQHDGEFAVSPSIEKLLEFSEDIEFDADAFAVFLRLGWLIAEDTLFSSIRALPPGSTLTWRKGEIKIESKGIIKSNPLKISRQEAIETYAELFQKAIEKNLPADENFVVPLSGGRDSRHILFGLLKANRRPQACLTILHPPPRPNEDARIAKQICEKFDLKHQILEQKRPRIETEIRKNLLTGFCAYEHGWFLALADFGGENKIVYDGIAGDVLSAGLFLTEKKLKLFRQDKLAELAEELFDSEGYIPKILTKEFYQKFSRERAVNHLIKELAKYKDQPNPVSSFYFWNRTRRCVAPSPFRILGDSVQIITPFLDSELFDFLMALPAEMFLDKQFHNETLALAFPEYATIPFEKKDAPKVFDAENFKTFSRDIFRYSRTESKRKMTKQMFFILRFLRSEIDKNYSQAVAQFGEQAVHLLQLERI